jgi:hypothetical protein
MDKSISQLADHDGLVDLGIVLGQTQAFGVVAGRCSAAQAAALQRLRQDKLYQRRTPHWHDFCTKFLNMSRAEADRIIRLWEEFGATYFEVAQVTRISAETYRAIAPSVKEGALHFNGEKIELNAENSRKVAKAVAGLRRSLAKTPKSIDERLAELEKRCAALIAELSQLHSEALSADRRASLNSLTAETHSALARLALESER